MSKRIRVNLSLNEFDVEMLDFFASRRDMPRSSYASYLLRQAIENEYTMYQARKDFPDDLLFIE